jgi:hypothetical protein
MRRSTKTIFLLFAVLAIVVITAMATLRGQEQKQPTQDKQQKIDKDEFESQFPIADYIAPESTDPEKRVRRQGKAKRLFKPNLTVHENAGVTAGTASQVALLDSLAAAAAKSNAVIVGQVTSAQAYLNSDKSNVYSEFTIRVDEVLKNDSYVPLTTGNSIITARNGGRIRYPSGRVTLYFIAGEGMPRIGHRYVLFLSRDEQEQDYDILTGYELRAGCVALLDELTDGHPLIAYKGTDELAFLNEIRAAISNSGKATPEERR